MNKNNKNPKPFDSGNVEKLAKKLFTGAEVEFGLTEYSKNKLLSVHTDKFSCTFIGKSFDDLAMNMIGLHSSIVQEVVAAANAGADKRDEEKPE